MWLKNSGGKPDAMFTIAIISFVVCTSAFILSLFSGNIAVGDVNLTLMKVDPTLFTAYMGGTLTAYVVRRNKKDQLQSDEVQTSLNEGVVR